jgi:triosephosphate isomerase
MQGVRRLFVGGNWKCNGTVSFVKDIATNLLNTLKFDHHKVDVLVAPVALHIPTAKAMLNENILIGAQNIGLHGLGAFTGEIAAEQLTDFGIHWTILGHSERRSLFGDTSEIVGKKVKVALEKGLSVVACIGEKLEERESNKTFEVCEQQLDAIKTQIDSWEKIVIAYEPVWAIGTGKVATPEQAQEVHAFIRKWLSDKVSAEASYKTRIIYGGSVNAKNAATLIDLKDVDGFLVGGASLKPEFREIVDACDKAQKQ